MPKVARKSGTDTVSINHPTCQGGTVTNVGSGDVFANSIGVVREGDNVQSHTFSPPSCPSHAPGLTSYSPNVYANNKKIGRLGDAYGCGATISSGSPNVYANG
jgi:uncharacterized Zn-binding protein involved in type VI secretion